MKLKIYTAITIALCIAAQGVKAQNTFPSSGKVGIGTLSPDASSLLEIRSNSKGFLAPRMTQAQRNAISGPATGLMVYVTDVNPGFYYYSGSGWVNLVSKKGWQVTGNSGLDSTANFIGTTDKVPLSIRTSNTERVHVSSNGNVGIGVTSPAALLHINGGGSASLTTNGYVLLGKTNNSNLVMDNDQIQARYNGSYNNLYLNNYGGVVYSGNQTNSVYGMVGYGIYEGVYGVSSSGVGTYGSSSSNAGVYGYNSSGNSGVYGYTGGGTGSIGVTGYCGGDGYGVYAYGTNGVGIYATSANNYAGFFVGNVYSSGTFTSSDEKLKQNITDMSSAMSIISQLKPKYYNFRQDGNYKLMNLPTGQHYGLIAQDVEKILPGLVKDTKFDVDMATPPAKQTPPDPKNPGTQAKAAVAKTGEVIDYKALNYTELIPIIIKGMQEMNASKDAAIADLQNQINQLKAMIVSSANTNTSALVSSAALAQNVPNPFSSATTIGYNLPSNYSSASIIVTDAKGVVLKQISLNAKGKGTMQLDASTLAAGAYRYSLYVDGKMIDSKQMISSK